LKYAVKLALHLCHKIQRRLSRVYDDDDDNDDNFLLIILSKTCVKTYYSCRQLKKDFKTTTNPLCIYLVNVGPGTAQIC